MNTRLSIAIALCAVSTTALLAQQTGSQQSRPTQDGPAVTFRSKIDAVEIDVFVTDTTGMPVKGLSVDDFELIENGKPQPITTFQAVDIPIQRTEEIERRLAEPDVLSNDQPLGRVYVFALDEVGGANILRTRLFLRRFIEQHFGPHDIGAVALLGRGLATDGQDFTGNRRLLLEALDKFSGGFGSEPAPASPNSALQETRPNGDPIVRNARDCNATSPPRLPQNMRTMGRSQQMASLRSLTELTARLPGRHKAMLLFSECFDVDVLDMVDYKGGTWGLAGDDAHAALMAATRSNLAIYPIDPTGLAPDAIPLEAIGAFRAVAEVTGGFALINSNSFDEAFERIVRENSTYYMLGFNSAYEKNDGRYVRVQVKAKRPDLIVHAREGYVAPTRTERREKNRAEEKPTSAIASALASPFATSGITMRVSAVPSKGNGQNANVDVTVEVDAATLDLVSKGGVYTGKFDLRYLATDAKRKIYPEVRHTADVKIEPTSSRAATSLNGVRVRVLTGLELPKGRYQLRVAAGTAMRAGNVVYDLEVPDFSAEPLTMSGVALVARNEPTVLTLRSSSKGGTARPVTCRNSTCIAPLSAAGASRSLASSANNESVASLADSPTTSREFAVTDEVVLTTHVYDNRRPERDAPHTVSLTTALRGADDHVITLTSNERPATSPQPPSGGHRFDVRLPLKDVPPGAYALEVTARSSANERDVVSQRIPIRVKAPDS